MAIGAVIMVGSYILSAWISTSSSLRARRLERMGLLGVLLYIVTRVVI